MLPVNNNNQPLVQKVTCRRANWSFWDVSTPATASLHLIELYGALANEAATDCAAAAVTDMRDEDYRFWLEVLRQLEIEQRKRRKAALAYWEVNGLATI